MVLKQRQKRLLFWVICLGKSVVGVPRNNVKSGFGKKGQNFPHILWALSRAEQSRDGGVSVLYNI